MSPINNNGSPLMCSCGHPASEHDLIDHDKTPTDAHHRRNMRVARWHWVCTADAHPDGKGESAWDHVCGCIVNVWEQEPGKPTVDPDTPTDKLFLVKPLIREALR